MCHCATLRRIHGWLLFVLSLVMLVGWGQLLIAQSQDGINATLQAQVNENRTRLMRLETWQEKVDERLSRLTWLTGAASGPLILEVLKFMLRSRNEKPNRINERRSYDNDDE